MGVISMNETAVPVCEWEISKGTIAKTSCGKSTNVYDDNPAGWRYCPYCGYKIKVKEVEEDNE